MFKVQGWVENGNITVGISGTAYTSSNKVQGSFPSGTVTVYLAGTLTLASIYSDDAASPTVKANPFTADTSGQWSFYASNGLYDIKFSGGGISVPFTLGGIQVGLGGGGVPSYTVAALPTSKTQNAGNLARVTDSIRGLWMDTGVQWAALQQGINIEVFGAVGDGTTLDDSAFAAAAAIGMPIFLRADRTYFVSQGITVTSGCRLIGVGGIATIKFKTGAGGFADKGVIANRQALTVCFFSASSVDNIGVENVRFITDGVAEVVIYAIRTLAGLTIKGALFRNIHFTGFAVGEMIGIGSAGDGSYTLENIYGLDCGASQGIAYGWVGGIQWTLFALDNDRSPSNLFSESGFVKNLQARNCMFTGQALADYGNQTDCFNHVGLNSDKIGPTILGIFVDGIGEAMDIFGQYCVIKGVHARNAYFVVALKHGGSHNSIEVDAIESCGEAAVTIAGSVLSNRDAQYNVVTVGSVTGVGTVQSPPGETAAVVFSGTTSLHPPKFNTVIMRNILGDGASMDYVVRDGGADNDLGNLVKVDYATGWATKFCDCPPDNVRIEYSQSTSVRLSVPSNQSITTTVPVLIDYSNVVRDINSEAVPASDKVRCKFPGRKRVHAQVRLTGHASNAIVNMEVLLNASTIASTENIAPNTADHTFEINTMIQIPENTVSSASADISVRITVTSAGTLLLTGNPILSFFEVEDLD